MSAGVFAVSRGIFDHEMFAKEPFTEREAWIWLIGEAAWKAHRARAGRALVQLERGQIAHSIRFMADAWSWHRSRVERFLGRLKTETMIETQTVSGISVVTICKYDEYQRVSLPTKTETETASETLPRQSRDRLEDRENIKLNIGPKPAEALMRRLKAAYPKRNHPHPWSKATPVFERQIRDGANPDDIVRAAEIYAAKVRAEGKEGTEFVKQITSFASYWRDVIADQSPARADGWPLGWSREACRSQFMNHQWPTGIGCPAPGLPGCKVPESIQAEWIHERDTRKVA